MQEAMRLCFENQEAIAADLRQKGLLLETLLLRSIPGAEVNGTAPRLATTLNLYIPAIDGETLLLLLDQKGVAVSHGSACASGALQPSRILEQMQLPRQRVASSLRFSISRQTTVEQIEQAAQICSDTVAQLRRL
jgi:cysteine desulfurase